MATTIINQFIEKFENADGILMDIPREELEQLIESISVKSKKSTRKNKKTKDPNAPKKPLSGYFIFLGEKRKEIREGITDESLNGRQKVTMTTKLAGARWKGLSEEEKKPYIEKSEEDKVRYKKEMEE